MTHLVGLTASRARKVPVWWAALPPTVLADGTPGFTGRPRGCLAV